MPKQNRVTPFGEIVAVPARGLWMGNRGCLHNDRQQIVRSHRGERWITCVLQFKERHRIIMSPGQYTELFFLDEATALAAGHRPCAECQRPRFEKFRTLWARANSSFTTETKPSVALIDKVLQQERMNGARQKTTYSEKLGALPEGTFVLLPQSEQPYLIFAGLLHAWRAEGYQECVALEHELQVQVLTPRSIVNTLSLGYDAHIHPSVRSR